MSRDDFPESTRRILAARVGWHCSFPNCGKPTTGPSQTDPGKSISIGIAAHITAAAKNGPRYDPGITSEQRGSIDNGIWMCRDHASLIDSDFGHYTVEQLRKWKEEAENKAHQRLINPGQNTGNNLLYSNQDSRAAIIIKEIIPYEIIVDIDNESFGKFVSDNIIKPFNNLTTNARDPSRAFDNIELETLRQILIKQAWEFRNHFTQHSAGSVNGYEYIDIKYFIKNNPETTQSYWEGISEETIRLAKEFCATAIKIHSILRNL